MIVSVVNSTTDTFYGNYAGDNVCCIYIGFEMVLSVTGMLVDLSVAIMQLEGSAEHMKVTVPATNFYVATFIVIMQMGVSFAIMQVVFSAVHYAYDCFYYNYADDSLFYSYVSDSFM